MSAILSSPVTLADRVLALPPVRIPVTRRLALDAALVVVASVLIALSARVAVPLPFTPVPITGQTFAVILCAMTLGARRGILACGLYLLEGAIGLPVFAPGSPGAAALVGSTAGYLWAFPLAAYVVGRWAEAGRDKSPALAALGFLLGGLIILALGGIWLSLCLGSTSRGVMLGVVPFLPGEMVKAILAAGLFPGAWSLLRRMESRTRDR